MQSLGRFGCPLKCAELAAASAASAPWRFGGLGPCADMATPSAAWERWWDAWHVWARGLVPDAVRDALAAEMKTRGCAALAGDAEWTGPDGSPWNTAMERAVPNWLCRDGPDQLYRALTPFCPYTCGCTASHPHPLATPGQGPQHCPEACPAS